MSDLFANHPIEVSPERVLGERERVGRVLGIPADRLDVLHTVTVLGANLAYFAEFSVAWSDLADEARHAREAAGRPSRPQPPATIGEVLEDRLAVRAEESFPDEGRPVDRTGG